MSVVVSSSFDFSFSIHPLCYDYDACILKISADWLPVSFYVCCFLLATILPNITTLILSLNFILLVHCIWWTVLLKNQSLNCTIHSSSMTDCLRSSQRYEILLCGFWYSINATLSCNRCFAYITILHHPLLLKKKAKNYFILKSKRKQRRISDEFLHYTHSIKTKLESNRMPTLKSATDFNRPFSLRGRRGQSAP